MRQHKNNKYKRQVHNKNIQNRELQNRQQGNITAIYTNRMSVNAQRDGRSAEYRLRPLFNTAQLGKRPLPECRGVTLPRRETR